jgi:superfamily I DNA and/or RNA helicase
VSVCSPGNRKSFPTREEYVAQRYDRLIADWVTHLGNLSEDEKRKLQEVYIKNANVIGITCGQAPKLTPKELRTFASFDTIIIDEVSKATAPELLLPAIKGKKLILIGDQHQLPPMIEDKTLAQMAEESGKEYRFLDRSYFKERYKEAPDAIKRMLSIQYRMHPDIMAAINQFYQRPLECGLNQPDIERDHQLESALVRKNRHLIWVTPPLVSAHAQKQRSQTILVRNRTSGREVFRYQSNYNSFGEEADGTSYKNYREVEIIEKICEEFQRIWTLKKAAGAERKEIGVITFYAAQEKLLYDRLLSRNDNSSRFPALNVRVGTVDRFQGMERAVIIVSMVRNNSQRDIGFARRDERINVAFSRAQELLVIVGCHDLFCGTARYEEAIERYNNVSKIVEKRGDFIDVSCVWH